MLLYCKLWERPTSLWHLFKYSIYFQKILQFSIISCQPNASLTLKFKPFYQIFANRQWRECRRECRRSPTRSTVRSRGRGSPNIRRDCAAVSSRVVAESRWAERPARLRLEETVFVWMFYYLLGYYSKHCYLHCYLWSCKFIIFNYFLSFIDALL